MCKGTHVTVFTGFDTVWIARTEFDLIFLRMIKLFDSIMSTETLVS